MLVLLDTTTALDQCEMELGCQVEQLITPLSHSNLQRPDHRFAIDNGAFASFKPKSFLHLLERESGRRKQCIFVAVPDVVGSARRTLEVFDFWHDRIHGWPLALVAQDGQEDMPIPWEVIDAVFIGGTTDWKLGPHARAIVKAAKAMDKWAHFGRVNTPARFEYARKIGCDSIDGTGLSRFTHMREAIHRSETGLFGTTSEHGETIEV